MSGSTNLKILNMGLSVLGKTNEVHGYYQTYPCSYLQTCKQVFLVFAELATYAVPDRGGSPIIMNHLSIPSHEKLLKHVPERLYF